MHYSEYHPSDPRRHELSVTEVEEAIAAEEHIQAEFNALHFRSHGLCYHCRESVESLTDGTIATIMPYVESCEDVLVHRACKDALILRIAEGIVRRERRVA